MYSLLAKGAWSLDVLFFLLLLLGIFLGVRIGFLKSVCKLAGTIFSVVIAVVFCVPLQASLERSFHWTTKMNLSMNRLPDSPLGKWIMVAICFVFLILLVRLGCWALGSVGTALIDRFAPIRIVNMILGGILGAFEMFTILFVLFAILRWIPSEPLHEFIASSGVVGKIFNPTNSSWFWHATHLWGR